MFLLTCTHIYTCIRLCAFYGNCNYAELYGLLCIDSQLNLQLAKNIDINNMATEIADAINDCIAWGGIGGGGVDCNTCVALGKKRFAYIYICLFICVYTYL